MPGFVRTRLVARHLDALEAAGMAVAEPEDVAVAALDALATGPSGPVWEVQAGRPAVPVEPPALDLARR